MIAGAFGLVGRHGIGITQYKHLDPAVLKRPPVGTQLHSASLVVEYRNIRIEIDLKKDKLITVR